MKNMILHIAITTLLASMSACSDEMEPVLTQRDWDGTATYFQSAYLPPHFRGGHQRRCYL